MPQSNLQERVPNQKLYLNPKISQVGSQLLRRLIVNHRKADTAGAFEIERAIVNENALFGLALGDSESDAEDAFLGFAGMDIAGTEENLEAFAQVEGLDAMLIQFERFVVDGADEISVGLYGGVEDRAGSWIFLGLGEHERGEFFTRKFSGTVEESTVEIFVDGDLPGVEGGKTQVVAVLKFLPIEMEDVAGGFAGIAIPAVGENDAADIPEEGGDGWHGNTFPSQKVDDLWRSDSTAVGWEFESR
jgi:hypothetical protein